MLLHHCVSLWKCKKIQIPYWHRLFPSLWASSDNLSVCGLVSLAMRKTRFPRGRTSLRFLRGTKITVHGFLTKRRFRKTRNAIVMIFFHGGNDKQERCEGDLPSMRNSWDCPFKRNVTNETMVYINVFCFTEKQTYRFLPWHSCVAKMLQEIEQCCLFVFSVTSEVWKMNHTYQESGSVVQYAL